MCVRRKGTLQPFHYYLSLTVVQLRREPVDRFRLAVGGIGGVYDQKQQTRVSGEPKRYFQYQAWGSTAQVVFAMLWPWLSTPKREQTEKAVRLVRERQWAGSSREGNR